MEQQPIPQDEIIQAPQPKLDIEKGITLEDMSPIIPEIDGTVVVLQRNAKDNRREDAPDYGALAPEAAENARIQAKDYFGYIFSNLDPEERANMDILVMASDTKLITPTQKGSEHKRALETEDQILAGIREAMAEYSINEDQLLNEQAVNSQIAVPELVDYKSLTEHPEYIEHVWNMAGNDPKKFWIAVEEDWAKEEREKAGAEGPNEIADRMNNFLALIQRGMKFYHENNPGRRAIVWAVSHYDSISPYAKKHVARIDPASAYMPIEQGAGLVINIGADGSAKTKIQEQEIDLEIPEPK